MDLGIAGRWAIVAASSRGLGYACAEALVEEGVNVVLNGRDEERLSGPTARLSALGRSEVRSVAADVTTAAGRATLLSACPQPDILITNNAGPTPGHFTELTYSDWTTALEANLLAPVSLIRAVIEGMRERRFGRIVNITSAMVTTPRPHMVLSTSARTALTAAVKALSLEVAADNVTINNLLPERLDTERQVQMAQRVVRIEGVTLEEVRRRQEASIAAKRLGRPSELGHACAFLCSEYAGFISGQNLHIDGGSYPGLV
jgi:3-oxoacyl-[acyl-carrier protein] reductase